MNNENTDIISAREGEELDINSLTSYLKGKLPEADSRLEVKQFSGGHANLTYLLKFDDKEYVLRRPPLGPVAPQAHNMGREYKALSVLYKGYPYAPKAFLFCDDPDIIGAPFFIMERKDGIVVRRNIPDVYGGGKDPRINRILSEVLIDALAELHKVDYRSIDLEKLGKAKGFMKRQVMGWSRAYRKYKTREIGSVENIIDWLRAEMPGDYNDSIVHNDWRLDNMMLDPDDPGKVVAVF